MLELYVSLFFMYAIFLMQLIFSKKEYHFNVIYTCVSVSYGNWPYENMEIEFVSFREIKLMGRVSRLVTKDFH